MREHQDYLEVEDEDDEFEPLFDYKRVCQHPIDDDSDEDVAVIDGKTLQGSAKRGGSSMMSKLNPNSPGSGLHKETDQETAEDNDWLQPPPKYAKVSLEAKLFENPTLLQLRQRRAELASWTAASEAALKKFEDNVKMEARNCAKAKSDSTPVCAEEVHAKREKVLVSIQNKDGVCKPFRIYMDDKFEKLFMVYAESISKAAELLVFCFDGQQIAGNNTPKDLGIENEDIIEVNMRT